MRGLFPLAGACLAFPSLVLLSGCGGDPGPPRVLVPDQFVRDVPVAEKAAVAFQRDLTQTLLAGLGSGDDSLASGALTADFRGTFPARGSGQEVADGLLALERYGPALDTDPALDAAGLVALLREHVGDWNGLARAELEADRFWLEPAQAEESYESTAVVRFELRLGGETPSLRRGDLRVTCRARAVKRDGQWRLETLESLGGTRAGGVRPLFRDITDEAGFSYRVSQENRVMLQAFMDRHRTFALGGLSVVDWNHDGFWDLLGTRRGQLAILFENDGAGGFVPRPLPMQHPRECGSFLLYVDLDGDGREELVNSQVLEYEGERAWCGLYTRPPGSQEWVHHPRAFEFANPLGLRGLSVQTVVPCDVDGDDQLDLFFAVYGSALSRRELYNTVEAYDGADNHLFLNRGELEFVEESEERGIHGTQYTYVAQAFDFDSDGDADLFEGNDFGPNILWLNDGQGHFEADEELGLGGVSAYTMGVTLADHDNSGRWSLYISNMSSEEGGRIAQLAQGVSEPMRERLQIIAGGNMLYVQDPGSGRWQERASELGCSEAEWAWGCIFWDPDNDGDRDLFVTNGFTSHSDPGRPDWQTFYWRQVVADAASLERGELSQPQAGGASMPTSFNGYERDRVFHNPGPGVGRLDPFFETGYLYGLDADHDGRCAAPVDMDGDGDLDLALWTLQGLQLLENRSPARHFVRLALEATTTEPHALGAEVRLTAGGVTRREVVRFVDGFQTQVPLELHMGLGSETTIERLEVIWPSGASQEWQDLPVDQRLVVREGQATVDAAPLAAWPADTAPRGTRPRLDVFLESPSGGSQALAATGKPTVLRVETEARAWPEFEALGAARPEARLVRVVPAGSDVASRPGVPDDAVPTFRASPTAMQELLGPGPHNLPVTVVFDGNGGPCRTFRREVSVSEVAAVLELIADEPPFPGLLINAGRQALGEGLYRPAQQLFLRALEIDDSLATACEGLARSYLYLDQGDRAEEAYARSVSIDPDYALGHFNLGLTRISLGRPHEAIDPLREALRITGDRARTLLALGEAAVLARQPEVALDAFERAARADPTDAEGLLKHGQLLGQLRRLEEARVSFRAALAIEPDLEEARRALRMVERLLQER